MTLWAERIHRQLEEMAALGRGRATPTFDAMGQTGRFGGQHVVSYAGNDYLGLSEHPAVAAAAHEAIDRWGTGSTASRLLVGTRPCHEDLERALAEWKQTDRALVFATGYQANLGVLSSLAGPDVTVISDELNHASIIDGCRLARAPVRIYRHRDVNHLEGLLAEAGKPSIVISDSVFSMDGDLAPVDDLTACCGRHEALLVLDEAHGVLGPHVNPGGAACELVLVGTLSKTLGSLGGFVAASSAVIDQLVNRARSFIFTTGLSPPDAAAARAAVEIVGSVEGADLVSRLAGHVEQVRRGHQSPVIPIIVGPEAAALEASRRLLDRGVFIPAVRPPTVPPGTSRLRIALSAAHTDVMIHDLLAALAETGLKL